MKNLNIVDISVVKYIHMEFREVPRKILSLIRKEAPNLGFTREQAELTFRLFSDQGAEGQIPKATFPEGSTITISQYPPGTILRETFVSLQEEQPDTKFYYFYCVGSQDKAKKSLVLFRSGYNNLTNPVFVFKSASLSDVSTYSTFFMQKINISEKSGDLSFKVGEENNTILDLCLRQKRPNFTGGRKTICVDIMQMGLREKEKGVVRSPQKNLKLSTNQVTA